MMLNGTGSSHAEMARQEKEREREGDRKKWKTLRDFVDDQAIEDVLENIESDRVALEVS